jgi:hypothetical protein
MKTFSIAFSLTISLLHAQGPLTPPSAPAPTMKSLNQIEARTPIESLPFTISASGSYYFTRNLQFSATSGNAININSNNVTLDLNGFTLSSTPSVTGTAIDCSFNITNVEIKNGNIIGNTTVAATGTPTMWSVSKAGFFRGIGAGANVGRNFHATDLRVAGCREDGIFIEYGSISDTKVTYCGNQGVRAPNGSATNITISYNNNSGVFITNGIVTNATAQYNLTAGIDAPDSSVTNSTANSNGGDGISAPEGNVASSTSKSNGGTGIVASCVSNSVARLNFRSGISALSIVNSTAISNREDGIVTPLAFGSITSCVARNNNTSLGSFVDVRSDVSVVALSMYSTFSTSFSTLTGNKN